MSLGVGSVTTDDEKQRHFKMMQFMMEAAVKLKAKSVATATAARIYHKFFSHNSIDDFDPHLIASTSLYLAGKVEEEHLKLRDIINVCYRCMYKEKPPLDIGSTYWALREAVTQCELMILRVLKFHVSFVHPHKYLLHYIKSLYDWLHPSIVKKVPIARTAWAILRDSYHSSICLRYDPEHIAVAALYLTLQSYGVPVPTSQDAEYNWWDALVEDLRIERVRRIVKEINSMYELEVTAPVKKTNIIEELPEVTHTKLEPEPESPKKEVKSEEQHKLKQEPKFIPPDPQPEPEPEPEMKRESIKSNLMYEDDIDSFLYSSDTSKFMPGVMIPVSTEPVKKESSSYYADTVPRSDTYPQARASEPTYSKSIPLAPTASSRYSPKKRSHYDDTDLQADYRAPPTKKSDYLFPVVKEDNLESSRMPKKKQEITEEDLDEILFSSTSRDIPKPDNVEKDTAFPFIKSKHDRHPASSNLRFM